MEEHPNVTAARKGMELFATGDMEGLAEFLAPDVIWHQIGGTTLHGIEELVASMAGEGDIDFDVDLHDVVGNDEHVVALVTAKVTAGDLEITYRVAEVCHMADGKITERWAMSDDTEAINRFFGSLAQETV
jgi:ketosteroid isomerase-like protein